MTEVFTVYWDPGARTLGAFPSQQEAEDFVTAVMENTMGGEGIMRHEFHIHAMPYQPNPLEVDL